MVEQERSVGGDLAVVMIVQPLEYYGDDTTAVAVTDKPTPPGYPSNEKDNCLLLRGNQQHLKSTGIHVVRFTGKVDFLDWPIWEIVEEEE